jgi:uncharacterized protein DUF222
MGTSLGFHANELAWLFDPDEPGPGILAALVSNAHEISRLQGLQVRLLAEFVAARPGPPGRDCSEFAPDEVSAALRWTHNRAVDKLHEAVVLTGKVPEVLDALEDGTLDDYRAAKLADAVNLLPDQAAHQVADYVLERAQTRNSSELQRVIRRAVLRFDPASAEQRRVQARADRCVSLTPQDNGMASLYALLPATEAIVIHRRLDAFARQAATPGDTRTHEQRRADALMDLLLDPGLGAVNVEVQVTVPATALTDGQGVADLPGYGPITAGHAGELAAPTLRTDPVWRRFVTKPATGELAEASPGTYRPSPRLAEFVRARDQYCVFPGCSWPARSCDIDHRIPHPTGATTAENLNALCRHHHRLKHEAGWTLEKHNNRYVWTDPGGIQYIKDPEPVAEPDRPEDSFSRTRGPTTN